MKTMSAPVLPLHEMMELVRAATLAPSGHNTQPWRFEIGDDAIGIIPDLDRRLPVVDADDHALYISLGAALENFRLAARKHGLDTATEYFEAAAPDRLQVRLSRMQRSYESAWYRAIQERQSTRSLYDGRPIPVEALQQIEAASTQSGVQLRLFTAPREIEAMIELIKEGNRRQMRDPAFVQELLEWVRFNGREAAARGDGLTAAVMGMPPSPRWMGTRIMRALLRPEPQAAQAEKLVRSSSGLILFIAERNDREHWVKLGQSFERVALSATLLGIRNAHMNMPCEVIELREELRGYLGLGSEQPLLLLRVGYGKTMPRSPRRPMSAVVRTC